MARTHAPPSQAHLGLRHVDSAGSSCKLFDNCYDCHLLILYLQTSHACLTSRLQMVNDLMVSAHDSKVIKMVDDMMVIAAPLHPSRPSINRSKELLLHLLHSYHEFLQQILSDFSTKQLGVIKLSWILHLYWFSLNLLIVYLIVIMLIKALKMIIFHNLVS
jgi:hypothetical protein